MYVAVPLAALLLTMLIPVEPAVKIALLVLAVSSGAPLLRRKLGSIGDGAYVFSLLVTSSLVAIVVVPASLSFLANRFDVAAELGTTDVALMLAKAFLLPLLVGMLVHAMAPERSQKIAARLLPLGGLTLTIAAMTLLALNWQVLLRLRAPGVAALFLLIVTSLAIGHCLGGPQSGQRTNLAVACATRHVGVAAVVATMIHGPQTLVLLASYVVTSAIVSYPYLLWRRRTAAVRRS